MRAVLWCVAIGVGGFALWHHFHNGDPTVAQVEPALRDYLESQTCPSGVHRVTRLDTISVGAYVEQFGGWPVYADHQEECRDGGLVSINDGSNDAQKKVAVAFARRAAGGRVEMFVPAIFQQGQREMQEQLQKAFDSVTIKSN